MNSKRVVSILYELEGEIVSFLATQTGHSETCDAHGTRVPLYVDARQKMIPKRTAYGSLQKVMHGSVRNTEPGMWNTFCCRVKR